MKKKLLISMLLIACMFIFTDCKKEPVTGETFTSTMTKEGFEVIDAKDQLEEGLVDSAAIAMTDGFQIEFY